MGNPVTVAGEATGILCGVLLDALAVALLWIGYPTGFALAGCASLVCFGVAYACHSANKRQ